MIHYGPSSALVLEVKRPCADEFCGSGLFLDRFSQPAGIGLITDYRVFLTQTFIAQEAVSFAALYCAEALPFAGRDLLL